MSTTIKETEWIWRDGEFVRWQDATVHILSTAVQFGSSVFEGIRCYDTERGPAVFRLPEHLRRLRNSARIYRMEVAYSDAELTEACFALIRRNGLRHCYIRPVIMRGYGAIGMDGVGSPIETWIPAWEWGAYLGDDALEKGVDVCVSSWSRAAPNTFPGMAKATGHYNNAQLIKLEAMANGFVEAIALTHDGLISEGSGQNLFAVMDGAVLTPPIDGSNLSGVTRNAVLTITADLDIAVREGPMPRELLYCADELFFSGTAAEITPIRSVDHIEIGPGGIGPVTRRIQRRFVDIVNGRSNDDHHWLTPVPPA